MVFAAESTKDSLVGSFDGKIPKSVIKQFFPGGQYLLLTFSGGPNQEITSDILHILRNYSVHASFFVYGQKVIHFPQGVQEIVSAGHDLGSSGFYSIVQLSRKSKEEISSQLQSAHNLLKNVTQREVKYFRPPGYFFPDALASWAEENPATKTILWTIDMSQLIREQRRSVEEVKEIMRTKTKPGDIIYCVESRATVKYLPAILEGLRAARFELLTLSEVLTFPDDSPH